MNLRRYIPSQAEALFIALLSIGVAAVLVALMGWPSWVPWSAAHQLPKVRSELNQTKDDLTVATQQGNLSVIQGEIQERAATQRLEIEVHTNDYVRKIEAAPDARTRQCVYLDGLCSTERYVGEPVCVAHLDDPGCSTAAVQGR